MRPQEQGVEARDPGPGRPGRRSVRSNTGQVPVFVGAVFAAFLLIDAVMAQTAADDGGAPAAGTPLTVRVSGAEPDTGSVGASLYASEEAFLEAPLEQQRVAVDGEGVAVLTFVPLSAGTFAVSAYWDENDNGKMDTGFMRIPKERVGFSNNAKGRFGPASWEDASFEIGAEPLEIDIRLVNARD